MFSRALPFTLGITVTTVGAGTAPSQKGLKSNQAKIGVNEGAQILPSGGAPIPPSQGHVNPSAINQYSNLTHWMRGKVPLTVEWGRLGRSNTWVGKN
jgi:hypothetical protein